MTLDEAVEIARTDTPDGLRHFMALIWGRPVPNHVQDWADYVYQAWRSNRGLLLEAFRGSTKTTFGVSLLLHQIGLYPWKSNALIQATDTSAKKNTKAIANIIEQNPKWKLIFPGVVPDPKRWGDRGYWVTDTGRSIEEWQSLTGLDPTLVGWGISSESIIGLHPTGLLAIDDIHNETNTASERELQTVIDVLQGTIFPTLVPTSRQAFIGTPWTTSDAIAYAKTLPGRFKHVRYPLFTKHGKSSWPEVFSAEEIENRRDESGELQFARMYLLDLEAAKGITLKREWINLFPVEDIKIEWPLFIGVDYASTEDNLDSRNRDYFAIVWGRIDPSRRLIIEDGWRGHVTQAEAEQRVITTVTTFPTATLVGVEAIGGGREFHNILLAAQTYLPTWPIRSHGKRKKGDRYQDFLAKLFFSGRMLLSNKTTEFSRVFMNEWVSWPRGDHDDTLDAVYMCAAAAADAGYITGPNMQRGDYTSSLWKQQQRPSNPFSELARA